MNFATLPIGTHATPSSFSLPPLDSLHIRPDGIEVKPKEQELPAGSPGIPDGLMFNAKPIAQRGTWNEA